MTPYIARRLLGTLPLLLAITFVTFAIMQAAPGGPLAVYRNNPSVRPADLKRIEQQLGLDKPMHVQYVTWLGNLLRGDWGDSFAANEPVLTLVLERLGNTLYLMLTVFVVTMLIAIPVGILSALKQYSVFDHLATFMAFIGFSVPIFWLGLIALIVFSVELRWLPAGGMRTIGAPFSIADRARFLILPVAVMSLHAAGQYTRYLRASMLDVLSQEYLTTARAKGLRERWVIITHALKNALIPLVTVIALDLPALFSGALLAETVFSWPGMGRLFWNSATRFDYPVLMALITITALLVVLMNLVADIVYAYLDPRIRYGAPA